jgi:hypothetical protein
MYATFSLKKIMYKLLQIQLIHDQWLQHLHSQSTTS